MRKTESPSLRDPNWTEWRTTNLFLVSIKNHTTTIELKHVISPTKPDINGGIGRLCVIELKHVIALTKPHVSMSRYW